jgi:hypothetical protein
MANIRRLCPALGGLPVGNKFLFRIIVLTASVGMLTALVGEPSAAARPRPRHKSFSANKNFGLGLMIGAPTGLAGKYYLSDDTALDFGVGAYYRYRYDSALHIHVDYLWHPAVLATADPFILPIYFGIGGRVLEHGRNGNKYDEHLHLGVRAPVGLLMDFNRVPLDIFFELALVFDIVVDSADHGYVDLNGAVGARFYF